MYDTIMQNYQQRRTRRQKTAFIELMQARYPALRVEKNGFIGSRNLIAGDPESAEIVFTAHYDTVNVSLLPNMVTPDRPYLRFFNMLLVISPIVLVTLAAVLLAKHLGASEDAQRLIALAVYWLMFLWTFVGGRPSAHTANDNTSGVLALCRLMDSLPDDLRDKAAFIFFDNEEYGCLGSGSYYRKHKAAMQDRLIFNMDCIGDGDTLLLVVSKKAGPIWEDRLRAAFTEDERFKTRMASAKKVNYTSDQKHFPVSVAVAAMNHKKWLGLYMDRIHTRGDTVCAPENIDHVCRCAEKLLKSV